MRWMDLIFLAIIITVLIFYYILKQGVEKSPNLKRKDTSALKYLEEKGYELVNENTVKEVSMTVGDKVQRFKVAGNLCVKKDGHKYLVIVRSTEETERLNNPALRNRLLLLYCVFNASAILFVNPEADRIQEIGFSFRRSNPLLTGTILTLVIIIVILLFLLLTVGGLL